MSDAEGFRPAPPGRVSLRWGRAPIAPPDAPVHVRGCQGPSAAARRGLPDRGGDSPLPSTGRGASDSGIRAAFAKASYGAYSESFPSMAAGRLSTPTTAHPSHNQCSHAPSTASPTRQEVPCFVGRKTPNPTGIDGGRSYCSGRWRVQESSCAVVHTGLMTPWGRPPRRPAVIPAADRRDSSDV
jgi:hypothetical protein